MWSSLKASLGEVGTGRVTQWSHGRHSQTVIQFLSMILKIVDLGDRSRPLLREQGSDSPRVLLASDLAPPCSMREGAPAWKDWEEEASAWRSGDVTPSRAHLPAAEGQQGWAGACPGAAAGWCVGGGGSLCSEEICCFLSVPPEPPPWGLEPHSSSSATVEGLIH